MIHRFKVCIYADQSGFSFTDLTGRAPGDPDGYPASLNLSNYTGNIKWYDKNGDLVGEYTVVPDATKVLVQDLTFAQDVDNNISDNNWYKVCYSLIDNSDQSVYIQSSIGVLLSKSYKCLFQQKAVGLGDDCCGSDEIQAIGNAKSLYDASTVSANAGDFLSANRNLTNAYNTLKTIV